MVVQIKKEGYEKKRKKEINEKKVKKLTEIGQTFSLQKKEYYNIITIEKATKNES